MYISPKSGQGNENGLCEDGHIECIVIEWKQIVYRLQVIVQNSHSIVEDNEMAVVIKCT